MMKISSFIFVFLFYVLVLVNTSQGQQGTIDATITATCNFTTCNSQTISCSSNLDCDCFSLTSKGNAGICGSTVFSCASVVRCNMDNTTCPINNTVCVNSTRCGKPVCYPLAFANKLVCPMNETGTTTTDPCIACTFRVGSPTNTVSCSNFCPTIGSITGGRASCRLTSSTASCITAGGGFAVDTSGNGGADTIRVVGGALPGGTTSTPCINGAGICCCVVPAG